MLWSKHRWETIGHIGDGNEYMVFTCMDCGCRATAFDGSQPDDTKYVACTKCKAKDVWDKLRGDDIL